MGSRFKTGREFAADLINLVLAIPQLNRWETKAKDAADGLPLQNRRWYAAQVQVVAVKKKYALSVDEREGDALAAVLCDDEVEEAE